MGFRMCGFLFWDWTIQSSLVHLKFVLSLAGQFYSVAFVHEVGRKVTTCSRRIYTYLTRKVAFRVSKYFFFYTASFYEIANLKLVLQNTVK